MRNRILVLGAALVMAIALATLTLEVTLAEEPKEEPPQFEPAAHPDGGGGSEIGDPDELAGDIYQSSTQCNYASHGDDPHLSSSNDAVSAHGWWTVSGITWGCPEYADVEVQLQVWLCNVYNPNDCYWKTLNKSESRIRPGGGAGRRTTARILCSTSSEIGYRSIIDVDLVGQSDPDDNVYKSANVRCRPLAW